MKKSKNLQTRRKELLESKAAVMWKLLKNYQLVYGDYLADSELTRQIENFIHTTESQMQDIDKELAAEMKAAKLARKEAKAKPPLMSGSVETEAI